MDVAVVVLEVDRQLATLEAVDLIRIVAVQPGRATARGQPYLGGQQRATLSSLVTSTVISSAPTRRRSPRVMVGELRSLVEQLNAAR